MGLSMKIFLLFLFFTGLITVMYYYNHSVNNDNRNGIVILQQNTQAKKTLPLHNDYRQKNSEAFFKQIKIQTPDETVSDKNTIKQRPPSSANKTSDLQTSLFPPINPEKYFKGISQDTAEQQEQSIGELIPVTFIDLPEKSQVNILTTDTNNSINSFEAELADLEKHTVGMDSEENDYIPLEIGEYIPVNPKDIFTTTLPENNYIASEIGDFIPAPPIAINSNLSLSQ